MKNSYIVLFEDLKQVPLLYIENDSYLSDRDKQWIEIVLSGMGKLESIDNFNITYLFDAFSKQNTFQEFEKFDNILLYTSFTGNSSTMLDNFIRGCQLKNIKNKRIFNIFNRSILSSHIEYKKQEIIDLDVINNVSLYTLPSNMFDCFVKFNSDFS